ncbi:MAG TPA: hypothetical protein VNE39_17825 [Planctomycetota bacterium]|nr:hypothetical protein [Planctomycetota bacterium]
MLRKLNLLLAVAALACVVGLVVLMSRPQRREGVVFQGKAIDIYGSGYTLARLAQLAQDAGHPEMFRYDPRKREALANASLIVHGSLQIGDPADPALGETLLLNTIVCGDLQVQVARGGELRIYHSVLQTVSQVITEEKCSRGYYFFADGTLEAADSRILYMSGARGKTVTANSRADLERVTFGLSDDVSFHAYYADGSRLAIRDGQFLCEGRYGVWVEGTGGEPLRLERCRLSGTEADLYLSGNRPAAELVDCQFRRGKVRFQQSSGRVAVRWTVAVKAVERGTGRPLANIAVEATSQGAAATETVRGRTGPDGVCPLVLTEYVATPTDPAGADPANAFTPHRVAALSAAGQVLAEARSYEARGARGTLTLEVGPSDLNSPR